MAGKDLGTKHCCYKCNAKFYDLRKPDPLCPKCGASQKDSPSSRPSDGKKSRLAAVPKIIEPLEPLEEGEEAAEEDLEAFDDDEEAVVPDDDEV